MNEKEALSSLLRETRTFCQQVRRDTYVLPAGEECTQLEEGNTNMR